MNKIDKIIIFFFFSFCFLDFFSSIYLLSCGFVEQNIILSLVGNIGFWLIYWTVSLSILLLMVKTKRIFILNIVSIPHLICGIHNLGLIL